MDISKPYYLPQEQSKSALHINTHTEMLGHAGGETIELSYSKVSKSNYWTELLKEGNVL